MRWTAQELAARGFPISAAKARSKYHACKEVVDGITFDSRLEARCYRWLKLRQAAGEIRVLLRQVPFHLEGGVVYRADFLALLTNGDFQVIDAKGRELQAGKNKLKQVKARYGIEVTLWRGA